MDTWLETRRGAAPLVVCFPHTGTQIPASIEQRLRSAQLARKDTDWWVDELYAFSADLGATTIRTALSRTVIDVNRDPSGASLYPGQATTELCPLTTFDGEPLYLPSHEPTAEEIANRRARYFAPYHAAIASELARLREQHPRVVLYDAHSIRSRVPRLFEGELPNFNIGTNNGATCDAALTAAIERACEHPAFTRVTNGRFRGGWTTRHYGQPERGVHAVQMELACRSYMDEESESWPSRFDAARAAPVRNVLANVLRACIHFALSR
jgi:N-formylglutamate deformylase